MTSETGRVKLRWGIPLVAAAAMLGTVVGVSAAAPSISEPVEAGIDFARMSGTGERIILVVAGAYETREAAERASSSFRFGDMAGFYIDASDHYRVIGYYSQSKPDTALIRCEDVPATAGECPPGTTVISHQTVSLDHHGLEDAPGLLTAATAGCDQVGQPPCTSKRLLGLLRQSDWQFKGGQQLLVSAFRTLHGAEEFAELARDRGATVSVIRALKLGGEYVGLGQETNPDGVSGPLLEPLDDPDRYQQ